MEAGDYNARIEIQVMADSENPDSFEHFAHKWAKVKGLSGMEFWAANAGGVAEEIVNVTLRYDKRIMLLAPQTTRFLLDGFIYGLESPPSDVEFKHKEIKFKARRQI